LFISFSNFLSFQELLVFLMFFIRSFSFFLATKNKTQKNALLKKTIPFILLIMACGVAKKPAPGKKPGKTKVVYGT